MNWFTSLEHIDWTRMLKVVVFITAFWIGLSEVIPDKYYRPVSIILTALQGALILTMRGGKYVETRSNGASNPAAPAG